MALAKMATPDLLKTTVFSNKGYDVIISVDDVTKKIYHVIQIKLWTCSCDQSLIITVAFLWKNLSPQFYKDLTKKTTFFEGWKLKFRTFWGIIHTFVEVTGEKLLRGLFALHSPPPALPHPE